MRNNHSNIRFPSSSVHAVLAGLLCAVLLCCCVPTIAQAESVLIRTRAGGEGQGWLFGAHAGEKCWIAVPAHVVMSPETGALEPFYFFDNSGKTGESAMPFSAAPEAQQTTADREAQDLAFARVRLGRNDGACHSRLGLPGYAYQGILGKREGFAVASMLRTSAGTFGVTLERKSIDSHGGAVIEFAVEKTDAEKFLRKGLSGATVSATDGGKIQPVAMVLKIQEDQTTLRALRYDYIKTRFDTIKLPEEPEYRNSADDGTLAFTMMQASYLPLSGDKGVSSLKEESGCWKAAALGGQRTVELIIGVSGSISKVETLEVLQSEACSGTPVKLWIDQRSSSAGSWAYVTEGVSTPSTSPPGASTPIRINLSGPRELRLRFDASRPVAISSLRLR